MTWWVVISMLDISELILIVNDRYSSGWIDVQILLRQTTNCLRNM